MMKQNDFATLREMQQEIAIQSARSLDQMAERLLRLRDRLSFDDTRWYHDFTQQVATLDSASTFHPANDVEKDKLDTAVKQASYQIGRLISAKMP